MRNRRVFLLFSMVLFCLRPSAHAEPVESFQLSFFHPAQIHDQDTSIDGFRFNLLYGFNKNMRGVDLGVVNHVDGNLNAFQLGLLNLVEGRSSGWQIALTNLNDGDGVGVQVSLFNTSKKTRGFQLGLVNVAETVDGLQLGLYNATENLHGLQIGLVNLNHSGEPFVFLPLINFSF